VRRDRRQQPRIAEQRVDPREALWQLADLDLGLNSRRLGCCLNLLGSVDDGGLHGVPVHILLRLLLQRCDTLTDALRLLLTARVAASSSIDVGYADESGGAVVAVELSPAGSHLVWPEPAGWLVHTNHFLGTAAARDRLAAEWPDTFVRWSDAREPLAGGMGPLTAEDLQGVLRSHFNRPLSVCCHDADHPDYADRQQTLASVVIDLTDLRLTIAPGPPCEAPYADV